MNKFLLLALFIGSFFYSSIAYSQLASCGASVPYFYVDMRGTPDSVWISPNISRNGQCCGVPNNENCISFELLLDSNTAGIQIDMIGADPSGSLFYNIDCLGNYPGGTIKCISGTQPQKITFCKPGGNKNVYIIRSIPVPIFPKDDSVRFGCNKTFEVLGLKDTSIRWNSITGAITGQYNNLLNCSVGCPVVTYTPSATAPAFIDYQICGYPKATLCGYNSYVCDTVRMYNFSPISANLTPDSAVFCDLGLGSGVTVTANPSGGDGNYSFKWYDSSGNIISTTNSYFATYAGDYSVEIFDGLVGTNCSSAKFGFAVKKGQLPVVEAGSQDKVCGAQPTVTLQGTVTNPGNNTYWTGGSGTFSPNNTSLLTNYTPSSAEILANFAKLYLVTEKTGCPIVKDSILIPIADSLKVDVRDTVVACYGEDVTIIPTISGGTSPYAYFWSNGSVVNSITEGEGTYSLQVTDSLGCFVGTSLTVSSPSQLNVSMSSIDVTSNGGSDGKAIALPSGGVPGYSYLWSPSSQTTDTAVMLSYGIYNVTINDTNGCITEGSVVVNEPRCVGFSASVSSTNNLCYNQALGTASVVAVGGTLPYTYLWSNGETTTTIDSLVASTYTVRVTDFNGCFDVNSIQITEPSRLNSVITKMDATTVGGMEGQATVAITGGTPSYTYLWNNGKTTATIDSLVAGVYSVTTTDNNGCKDVDSVRINEPPCANFLIGINKKDTRCFGDSTGEASLVVLNGLPPYSILWSNGATSIKDSNLHAGTYTVNIADSRGCATFGNVTINNPAKLAIGLALTNISCFGKNDGTIDATISGGTKPYSYVWSNGSNVQDIVNLSNGKYVLSLTDANGCKAKDSSTIVEPSLLTASFVVTDLKCFQGSNGSIDLTVSGGILPYKYTWSSGDTTQDISSIVSGGYTVVVKDANSCALSSPLVIGVAEPDSLHFTSMITSCPVPGKDSALVNLTPAGGSGGPYRISYDNGTTYQPVGDYDFYLKTNTTYILKIQDNNLCESVDGDTLYIRPTVTIDSIRYNPCSIVNGASQVQIFPNGGTLGAYQMSVDSGVTFLSYGDYTENLTTNRTYFIQVRDSLGCSSKLDSIFVYDSLKLTTAKATNYNGSDISCYGLNDAVITTSVTGGKLPYTYLWSNASTNDSLLNAGAGTYNVIVTDNNGCVVTASNTISQPDSISHTVSKISLYNGKDISCYGFTNGMGKVAVTGGTGAYTYAWSNATSNDTLFNVGAGKYLVTVTDINGCGFTDSLVFVQPDSLATTTSVLSNYNGEDISCYGLSDGIGKVTTIGGTGPYSYAWSNGTTKDSLLNVSANTYQVVVTDANGCFKQDSLTITQPAELITGVFYTSFYNGQNISCNGANDGQAKGDAFGGTGNISYSWSNGTANDTLFNVGAGTYTVTISDANGCFKNDTITFTEPTSMSSITSTISNYNGKNISCKGASDGVAQTISSGGTGAYTYLWSNASVNDTLFNVGAGKHFVTITDANGCKKLDSIVLTEPDSIQVEVLMVSNYNGQNISCYGASDAIITAQTVGGVGAYIYTWSNGGTTDTLIGLDEGTYTVTVKDANGCSKSGKIDVYQPDSLSAYTQVLSNYNGAQISCYDSTNGVGRVFTTGGTGAYSYLWTNGTTSELLVNVGRGTYGVTIKDINNCTLNTSLTFVDPDTLSITYLTTNVSCNGGNDGTIDMSTFGGTPGYSFLWDGPGQFTSTSEDLLNAAAGSYTVTITDTNNCKQENLFVILDPSALSLDFTYKDVNCYNGNDAFIDMIVTGGTPSYVYAWTSNNGFIFADSTAEDQYNLEAGVYTIRVTDSNNCFTTIVGTIAQPDSLALTYTSEDARCFGYTNGKIAVEVKGGVLPYTYTWSNGGTADSIENIGVGEYYLTLTDSNNCLLVDTFQINHPDSLLVDVFSPVLSNGYNITYNQGNDGEIDAFIIGGTTPYTYQWNNGSTDQDLFGLTAGMYVIEVTDSNGCLAYDSITIIDPLPLTLPTGFTPNFDGANDKFFIRGLDAYPQNQVTVYNRWGDIIFKAVDYTNTWDGTNNAGSQVPDGTYFVILEITSPEITLKGYLDLRR